MGRKKARLSRHSPVMIKRNGGPRRKRKRKEGSLTRLRSRKRSSVMVSELWVIL